MTMNDQITDEKLQNDINREAAKISSLLSGRINNYEYFTRKEILPPNQKQMVEQAKFTYSLENLLKMKKKNKLILQRL